MSNLRRDNELGKDDGPKGGSMQRTGADGQEVNTPTSRPIGNRVEARQHPPPPGADPEQVQPGGHEQTPPGAPPQGHADRELILEDGHSAAGVRDWLLMNTRPLFVAIARSLELILTAEPGRVPAGVYDYDQAVIDVSTQGWPALEDYLRRTGDPIYTAVVENLQRFDDGRPFHHFLLAWSVISELIVREATVAHRLLRGAHEDEVRGKEAQLRRDGDNLYREAWHFVQDWHVHSLPRVTVPFTTFQLWFMTFRVQMAFRARTRIEPQVMVPGTPRSDLPGIGVPERQPQHPPVSPIPPVQRVPPSPLPGSDAPTQMAEGGGPPDPDDGGSEVSESDDEESRDGRPGGDGPRDDRPDDPQRAAPQQAQDQQRLTDNVGYSPFSWLFMILAILTFLSIPDLLEIYLLYNTSTSATQCTTPTPATTITVAPTVTVSIPVLKPAHRGRLDMPDYYGFLNVAPHASPGEIDRTYYIPYLQRTARGMAEARAAYNILSDPVERCVYDALYFEHWQLESFRGNQPHIRLLCEFQAQQKAECNEAGEDCAQDVDFVYGNLLEEPAEARFVKENGTEKVPEYGLGQRIVRRVVASLDTWLNQSLIGITWASSIFCKIGLVPVLIWLFFRVG